MLRPFLPSHKRKLVSFPLHATKKTECGDFESATWRLRKLPPSATQASDSTAALYHCSYLQPTQPITRTLGPYAYTRRTRTRQRPPSVLQRMGRDAGNGPLGDFDLDESPDAPPVSEQIVTALMANAGKVLDLFRSWDEDGDGTGGRRTEFHHAMKLLGLEVPSESIDEIFTGWDQDGGGEISLRELTQILNAAATTTKNMQHLRKTLGKKKLKIVAMFKHGDVNGDNELDKLEFKSFLKRLGIMLPKDQLTWLFEKLDHDKSGKITFRELDKALKLDEEKERAARKAERGGGASRVA